MADKMINEYYLHISGCCGREKYSVFHEYDNKVEFINYLNESTEFSLVEWQEIVSDLINSNEVRCNKFKQLIITEKEINQLKFNLKRKNKL